MNLPLRTSERTATDCDQDGKGVSAKNVRRSKEDYANKSSK